MRLILLVERYDDTSRLFHYEFTPVPTSLFKDGFIRHPNKASLASALTSNSGIGSKRKRKTSQEDNSETSNIPSAVDIEASEKSSYVLDGGALLHRVPWNGITFNDVINQYQVYVMSKYRKYCVVFDGYSQHTTKDDEQLRMQQKGPSFPDIVVTENIEVHNSREDFLTNEGNKQQLISLLVKRLKEDGHTVRECESDADTNIVDSALELACHGKPVTVIADDTDILVLLLYFWNSEMTAIYMRSEPKKQQNLKLVNISKIAGSLNTTVRNNMLFIHAWVGCDTTSAIFNRGKTSIFRLINQGKKDVLEVCTVFDDSSASSEPIAKAGIRLFVIIYGGRHGDNLGHLRRVKFTDMSLKSEKSLQPECLPPTEGAAKQHSLRVFLQIMFWKTLMTSSIDPTEWGWRVNKECLLKPTMTEEELAPEEILHVVRCKCKLTSNNQCGSSMCSCHKNGLSCVSACGECNGVSCNNEYNAAVTADEDDGAIDDGNIFDRLF